MARFSNLFRSLYLLPVAVLSLVTLSTSCTNDGDIGDLYGKWQLEHLDAERLTPEGDRLHYYLEWQYNDNRAYFNFEGQICQMQIANDVHHELTSLWGSFRYTADSLFITVDQADYVEGTTGMDGLNSPKLLKKYFEMEFAYDEEYEKYDDTLRFRYVIDGQKLLLSNDSTTWQFRHYGF